MKPLQRGGDTIVLVGLMGAGKSGVGRRLAESLGLPFVDSDEEIEKAAGCGVTDIFDVYGEPAFRDCERSVIARLLNGGPSIIATGGGAFMEPGNTRNHQGNINVYLAPCRSGSSLSTHQALKNTPPSRD